MKHDANNSKLSIVSFTGSHVGNKKLQKTVSMTGSSTNKEFKREKIEDISEELKKITNKEDHKLEMAAYKEDDKSFSSAYKDAIEIYNYYNNIEDEKQSKILIIEILESLTFKQGTVFKINKEGLMESKRKQRDGKVFFGTSSSQEEHELNDIIFSTEEKGFGKRHFSIEYDSDKDSYFLNDLSDGTGTFIKIINKFGIKTNIVVSINIINLRLMIPPVRTNNKKPEDKTQVSPKNEMIDYNS